MKNPDKKLEKILQLEMTKSVPDYMLVHKKTWVRRLKIVFYFQAFYYLTPKQILHCLMILEKTFYIHVFIHIHILPYQSSDHIYTQIKEKLLMLMFIPTMNDMRMLVDFALA